MTPERFMAGLVVAYKTAKQIIADHGEAELLSLSRADRERIVAGYVEQACKLTDDLSIKDIVSIAKELK